MSFTSQETFDQVTTHLMTQRRHAVRYSTEMNQTVCVLRAEDGCRCAVGGLIDPADYEARLEEYSSIKSEGGDDTPLRTLLRRLGHNDFHLLDALQTVHDSVCVVFWAVGLMLVAKEFGLSDAKVHELMDPGVFEPLDSATFLSETVNELASEHPSEITALSLS